MEELYGMTVGEIAGRGIGILFLLSLFIEITPIKWSPLSSILKWLGNKLNADIHNQISVLKSDMSGMNDRIAKLDEKVDVFKRDVADNSEMHKAVEARTHVLTFGGEEARGDLHTKEEFDNVLAYMDEYQRYCDSHPEFPNNRTNSTCAFIKRTYDGYLESNGFLK